MTLPGLHLALVSLLNDLQKMQISQDTIISKKYSVWPLKHPNIQHMLSEMDTKDADDLYRNLKNTFLKEFNPDLESLRRTIQIYDQCRTIEHENKLRDLISMISIKADTVAEYGILCDTFCPELPEYILTPEFTHKMCFQLLRTIDIIDKVDTCVSCFRRDKYLDMELVWQAIKYECQDESRDCVLLIRGSTDFKIDKPIKIKADGKHAH
eukprot:TRINITY_DN4224_c0_g1_i1.p1 TRINITY_DN4224_c0_g1~~TRINITY_DN4224_c0_g1_i1.p1  ORF type:complete len:210 (+),score=24.09 TRINITY_DN4224_c0_g1_i1:195-824(+)